MDDLLTRIRARIEDPERRVDTVTNAFSKSVQSLHLGQLFAAGRSAAADLARVVDANQAGRRIDPDIIAKVDQLGASMDDVITPDLRRPLDATAIDAAEARIGARLPVPLRRVYGEVADGGFGPGGGLLPLADAAATYTRLRVDPPGPPGQDWPEGLLPMIAYDPGYDCVDLTSGKVIAWDPEGLSEYSGAAGWRRTFTEIAPSVETWLDTWVGSRSQAEEMQEKIATTMVEEARKARAMVAAMSPEERAAMGLPEVGWEREVWGGIGLDDEPS